LSATAGSSSGSAARDVPQSSAVADGGQDRPTSFRRLPPPTSPLIGREADVAQVIDMLARSRLVTLIGAGGVGKTRLALEVARRMAPSFTHGAAFVDLADLDDPLLVATEIARSLDLVDVSGPEPAEGLRAALRSLRLLLVIDNFEQLVAAAPVLASLIAECPEITLLVTSRRRLGVSAERLFQVAPLPVPAANVQTQPTEAASVALFCERASAVSSQFHPDAAALEAVGELCRLVDGLPLAVELVASHVRWLRPEVLLARMRDTEHGLRLLRGGAADVHARHRDLRDTIGWSVDLLGATPRRLLPRLSVFREGWTLDAMEDLCCWDIVKGEAFEALLELVDLHLVETVNESGDDPRFRLLETIRRFAAEALADSGEADALLLAHANYYVTFALRAGTALQSTDDHRWAVRVDRELSNVRAALHHLAASGRMTKGLEAVAALGPYWLDRGSMQEGRDWLDRFLPAASGPPHVRAVGEGWSARLALEQDGVGTAPECDDRDEQLWQAREVLAAGGDDSEWLRLTDHLSNSLHLQGRFADADALLAEAVQRCRAPETAWLRAELSLTRAVNAQDSGEFGRERVAALFEEAIDAARLAGHDRARAQALGRMSITLPLHTPAAIDARTEIERAFRLSEELGDRRNAARSAVVAAVLALADQDRAAAATWFVRSLDVSVAIGYWHGLAWSVMGVAGMAAHAGRLVDGARLHGAIRPSLDQVSKETPEVQLTAYHRLVDVLREGLGETFEDECRTGNERDWTVTVDEARRIAVELSGDTRQAAHPSHGRPRHRRSIELTERELAVLRELAAGHTNEEIASALAMSQSTVMHHTVSVYRKLAVRGRAEAVAHALRTGLVAG
jgi:predicted ATPase/DNA-binding CsgD family transcriptional regulator